MGFLRKLFGGGGRERSQGSPMEIEMPDGYSEANYSESQAQHAREQIAAAEAERKRSVANQITEEKLEKIRQNPRECSEMALLQSTLDTRTELRSLAQSRGISYKEAQEAVSSAFMQSVPIHLHAKPRNHTSTACLGYLDPWADPKQNGHLLEASVLATIRGENGGGSFNTDGYKMGTHWKRTHGGRRLGGLGSHKRGR